MLIRADTMIKTLEILSFVLPVVAVFISVIFGAAQVRRLREKTGDKSLLTSILGMTFF
jgi:hypothetical protein